MDNNSLAHTKWECKYHIVIAPGCSSLQLPAVKPAGKSRFMTFRGAIKK
ncbi:MAG: hypothetical protein GXZ02_04475 [Clostridiales bacterium]|jgi:hypothetical protein|nr:hypothetical protein [Clostridiales bacterium]